jgi:hypothetical protein
MTAAPTSASDAHCAALDAAVEAFKAPAIVGGAEARGRDHIAALCERLKGDAAKGAAAWARDLTCRCMRMMRVTLPPCMHAPACWAEA